MGRTRRRFGNHAVGGMRGKLRHRPARAGDWLGFGAGDIARLDRSGRGDAVEDTVTRGLRRGGVAVGPPRFRRLRKRDQKRGLPQRKAARLVAEISKRSGTNSFNIAAIRSKAQVKL